MERFDLRNNPYSRYNGNFSSFFSFGPGPIFVPVLAFIFFATLRIVSFGSG
jgi:hypothetical protein